MKFSFPSRARGKTGLNLIGVDLSCETTDRLEYFSYEKHSLFKLGQFFSARKSERLRYSMGRRAEREISAVSPMA